MLYKNGVMIVPNWQFEFMSRVVDHVWSKLQGHQAMMTSGCERFDFDGIKVNHSNKSYHWQFLAWDFRIYKNNDTKQGKISAVELKVLVKEIKKQLGGMFDVVLEGKHIHIEFDPDK